MSVWRGVVAEDQRVEEVLWIGFGFESEPSATGGWSGRGNEAQEVEEAEEVEERTESCRTPNWRSRKFDWWQRCVAPTAPWISFCGFSQAFRPGLNSFAPTALRAGKEGTQLRGSKGVGVKRSRSLVAKGALSG